MHLQGGVDLRRRHDDERDPGSEQRRDPRRRTGEAGRVYRDDERFAGFPHGHDAEAARDAGRHFGCRLRVDPDRGKVNDRGGVRASSIELRRPRLPDVLRLAKSPRQGDLAEPSARS